MGFPKFYGIVAAIIRGQLLLDGDGLGAREDVGERRAQRRRGTNFAVAQRRRVCRRARGFLQLLLL